MDRTFVVAVMALLVAALAFGQAAGMFELPQLDGLTKPGTPESDIGLVLPRAYPAPVDPVPVPYPQPESQAAAAPPAPAMNLGSRGEGTEGGQARQVVISPKWAIQPDENPGDYCLMQVGVLLRYEPKEKSVLPHAEIPPGAYMYREKTEIRALGWLLVSGSGQLGWVKDGECR